MITAGIRTTEPDPEFAAMWDGQMLDYPTITRNEAGEWNYFDVTPETPEMVYDEDGKLHPVDGLQGWELQHAQGEELAYQTLKLAGRYCEANSCALSDVSTYGTD